MYSHMPCFSMFRSEVLQFPEIARSLYDKIARGVDMGGYKCRCHGARSSCCFKYQEHLKRILKNLKESYGIRKHPIES